jgi:hypothetical protein
MILIVSAIMSYAIVTGEDPALLPLDFDHNDNYNDWKAKDAEAGSTIRLSCFSKVWRIIKGIRNPHEMWNTLETSLDTARSYIGSQDILSHFRPCRAKEDEPLKAYITMHSNYCLQPDHTDNAVTDRDIPTQIFTSLLCQYAMILIVLKHRRPLPISEEAMHDFLEAETTARHTKELGDAFTWTTSLTQCGGYRGRGRGGCGGCCGHSGHDGSSGTVDSHESQCSNCKMDSHPTDACRKRKRAQEGCNNAGNNECIGFQCGLPGHVNVDCVSYKCIKEWWKVQKAIGRAALATTRDCNPFCLTSSAVAAPAAGEAPKWVIYSGASHHMCNNCSSFSTFKTL